MAELKSVYDLLSTIANGDCSGADWSEHLPGVSQFENLSYRFYQIIDNITDGIKLDTIFLNETRDAKAALNRDFMSVDRQNPYPALKRIFNEIDCIYAKIIKAENL